MKKMKKTCGLSLRVIALVVILSITVSVGRVSTPPDEALAMNGGAAGTIKTTSSVNTNDPYEPDAGGGSFTPSSSGTKSTSNAPKDTVSPDTAGAEQVLVIDLNNPGDSNSGLDYDTDFVNEHYSVYYVVKDDDDSYTTGGGGGGDSFSSSTTTVSETTTVTIEEPDEWIWAMFKYDRNGNGEIDDSIIDPYIGSVQAEECHATNWIYWDLVPLTMPLGIQQFSRSRDTSINNILVNNSECLFRGDRSDRDWDDDWDYVRGVSTDVLAGEDMQFEREIIPANVIWNDVGGYIRLVIPEGYKVVNWAQSGSPCTSDNDSLTAFDCRDMGDNDDGDDGIVFLLAPDSLYCQSFANIYLEGTGGACTPQSKWDSGDSACYTRDPNVSVFNNVFGETSMSLTDAIPADEWCIDIDPDDDRWQNVSLGNQHDWTVDLGGETRGEAKVCAKFSDDVITAQCGGMIQVVDSSCAITSINGYSGLYSGQEATYSISYAEVDTNPQDSSVDYRTSARGILDPNSRRNVSSGVRGNFETTFTGAGEVGDVVDITATARFETLDGESIDCTPLSKQITIVPRPGWWQALGADIWSLGDIVSLVPVTDFLNKLGLGGYSGVAITGEGGKIDVERGEISEEEWIVHTDYKGDEYNYNYFENKVVLEAKENWSNDIGIISGSVVNSDELVDNCTDARVDEYCWLKREGNLTLGSQNIGDEKIVLFVDGGTLTIDGMINLNDGDGFFMVIVGENDSGAFGNISVAITDDAGGNNPELEGIFIVDNFFSTGNVKEQLRIRGSVAAWGGILLERDLEDDNDITPAEMFEYAPDLYLQIPIGEREMRWKEVAP